MLVAAFAAFFAFIIMYNRVEFVISKDEAWRAGKDKDKVAAFMQVITGHLQSEWPPLGQSVTVSNMGLPDWTAITQARCCYLCCVAHAALHTC